jgi:hypothetical protein
MSDRHYSTEYEWFERVGTPAVAEDEPTPLCAFCRRTVNHDLDENVYRCATHGVVVPEFVYEDAEAEE